VDFTHGFTGFRWGGVGASWDNNPFFLLLKLPLIKKHRIGVALPFFFGLATIGFSIVVIENQL